MLRKIIKIDEDKCNGCGACAAACHEGAIEMVNGKAKLTREDYCDGLGDCLPACPTNARSFEEREAPAYNEAAVLASKSEKINAPLPCGCPGTNAKAISRPSITPSGNFQPATSQLSQWPCQIKLVPENAPYLDGANLLIAADCTAYAYGNFHNEFIRNHITLIGCPKLDKDQSRILPSVEIVTTCQGMNFPLACSARLTALSMPPQQGTSMRTTLTLLTSLRAMMAVSFSA